LSERLQLLAYARDRGLALGPELAPLPPTRALHLSELAGAFATELAQSSAEGRESLAVLPFQVDRHLALELLPLRAELSLRRHRLVPTRDRFGRVVTVPLSLGVIANRRRLTTTSVVDSPQIEH
jgi:hypothetical protein